MTLLCSSLPIKSRLHLLRRRRCNNIVAGCIVEPATGNCNDWSRSGPVHSNSKQKFHRTMSTSGTRAAAAATSRHVKQKLVKLLFQEKNNNGKPFNSLDHFSYDDLRREYLKRLQLIHPDKINANSINANRRRGRSQQHEIDDDPLHSKEALKREFQDLQSTWDKYEELTKSMTKVIHGDGATANFTQFGVGCSFSDNEEERALRTEITDQACRGWFSSGLVSSGLSAANDRQGDTKNHASASSNFTSEQKSLIDDSMFVQEEGREKRDNLGALSQETKPRNNPHRRQRTLIPGIN